MLFNPTPFSISLCTERIKRSSVAIGSRCCAVSPSDLTAEDVATFAVAVLDMMLLPFPSAELAKASVFRSANRPVPRRQLSYIFRQCDTAYVPCCTCQLLQARMIRKVEQTYLIAQLIHGVDYRLTRCDSLSRVREILRYRLGWHIALSTESCLAVL